jgi:phage/plasmid-like protein (TIGR03299 family)
MTHSLEEKNMSQESTTWLNTMTLVGFTEKRGMAWHYRESSQGAEPNHYPGAIPVADVERRLFDWEAVERDIFVARSDGSREHARRAEGRKAVVRSDSGDVLGIFKDGYKPHPYREWLIDKVAAITGNELSIGSAGLLRNGGVAWVQVELPESIQAAGVEFRPSLLAATSFDGSLSSTYGPKVQIVVCDNTLDAALGESGRQIKVKHSRFSNLTVLEAREALAIVHAMGDDFSREIEALCAHKVSESAFERMLDLVLPLPAVDANGKNSVRSSAPRKRDEIVHLYRADERCAPWRGTAFGVLQAFNTWQHHVVTVKGEKGRVQRNFERAITGVGGKFDAEILTAIQAATQHEVGATL